MLEPKGREVEDERLRAQIGLSKLKEKSLRVRVEPKFTRNPALRPRNFTSILPPSLKIGHFTEKRSGYSLRLLDQETASFRWSRSRWADFDVPNVSTYSAIV
jgi:hypothetical protein